jgi:hypothetical protein
MGIPLRQVVSVGAYVMRQHLAGRKRWIRSTSAAPRSSSWPAGSRRRAHSERCGDRESPRERGAAD